MKKGLRRSGQIDYICEFFEEGTIDLMKKGLRHESAFFFPIEAVREEGTIDLMKKGLRPPSSAQVPCQLQTGEGTIDLMKKGLRQLGRN